MTPIKYKKSLRLSITQSNGIFLQSYSKTVLGCKEHRRYEMGVQKIVFRGHRPRKRIFLRHPSSTDGVPATSHCFAIIIYLISPINHELMPIYRAEQSGPDQMLLPAHM